MQEKIRQVIACLEQNNMAGYYVADRAALLALLAELIKPGECVGCGDSVTLEQTGVFEFIRNGGYTFLDKHRPNLTAEEKRAIYLKNFDADTFLTGVNAVTQDGRLFNIDGNGSRVAPMLYGPRQVIVVAGVNKLAPTLKDAITRARQVAAVQDAARLGKSTPCVRLGRCIDCHHEQRICNDFVLIARQFTKNRIKVVFIDGEYGF